MKRRKKIIKTFCFANQPCDTPLLASFPSPHAAPHEASPPTAADRLPPGLRPRRRLQSPAVQAQPASCRQPQFGSNRFGWAIFLPERTHLYPPNKKDDSVVAVKVVDGLNSSLLHKQIFYPLQNLVYRSVISI
ncbi:unnamed protein product [Citrullus colocynthis]|uniref:Uncharacterized protein n=1 Tax=Citrullus colocynthis TaxID=252529 RepID=A0ABP0Z3F5_9ROSI